MASNRSVSLIYKTREVLDFGYIPNDDVIYRYTLLGDLIPLYIQSGR